MAYEQPIFATFPELSSSVEDVDYDTSYRGCLDHLDLAEGGILYCNFSSDIYRRKALAFSNPAVRIDYSSAGMEIRTQGDLGSVIYPGLPPPRP